MATAELQSELGVTTEAPTAPSACPIILTEKAAGEVRRIIAEQAGVDPSQTLRLRLRVVGGGCSGFQHKLDLDPEVKAFDETFVVHGVGVVIDKKSKIYLEGVKVDFHDDLNKRGFSIENPSARGTCGCGSSFSM